MTKFAKKKKRFLPTTSPSPFGTKIKAWKKGGHLVPKMVKKNIKILTQLSFFIHNWVITDIQWMIVYWWSVLVHLQAFFIQHFSSNQLDDGANRVAPKKSRLVERSSFATSSPKSGPVRSDRSSQVRQVQSSQTGLVKKVQSQAILEIWELSICKGYL